MYLMLQDLTLVMTLLVALHLCQQPVLVLQLPLQQSSVLQGIRGHSSQTPMPSIYPHG